MTAGSPTDWRRHNAFGLPAGSIRALLALAIFGTVWARLALSPEHRLPEYLQNLMFIILGHYFAARGHSGPVGETGRLISGDTPVPSPLYLPRGMIRILFVGGFIAIGILLVQQERVLSPDGSRIEAGALTLILVLGFLLGVASKRLLAWIRRPDKPLPRIIEDLRAAIAIVAVGLLLLVVFEVWRPAAPFGLPQFIVEDSLAATVGFYFGSRS